MKQAEIAAHSSGRKGGESRVFDAPLIGVLQMIATATVLKRCSLSLSICFDRYDGHCFAGHTDNMGADSKKLSIKTCSIRHVQ
jgi:hypothetical protein